MFSAPISIRQLDTADDMPTTPAAALEQYIVPATEILSSPHKVAGDGFGKQRRWLAHLKLGFERRNDRTALPRLSHEGPLRVQRPFYPEGEVCHVYLLHPPGGLVSGDQLRIEADVSPQCHTLITTPSAGKIYKGDSCAVSQCQQVRLTQAADSILEWLPQETILYDGALGRSDTYIELSGTARFIGWELICLGRPASNIRFNQGHFVQNTRIHRDGQPLLLEKQNLLAGSALASQHWGLQGYPQVGSLYAVGFNEEPTGLLEQLRASLKPLIDDHLRVAITWRRGVLVARLLAQDSEQARQCFTRLWQQIRPALLKREAVMPRIWLT